ARLQGGAVAEGDVPRQAADAVDGVEVGGCLLVRLAAREESDARHGRGHAGFEQLHGFLRHLIDAGTVLRLLARDHHVGLEHHAFERDPLIVELLEHGLEQPLGDDVAALGVVIAVHQHFRLDDRNDVLVLTKRGVTPERVRVGHDCCVARDVGADVDHRAPFGELGAEPAIFHQALAQTIQALGDQFAGSERQRLRPLVDLDARDRARVLDHFDQRGAVLGGLADGLVVENDAGNVFRHRLGRAKEQLAVVAAIVGARFHADRVEAVLDGTRRLVGGENAAARRDHGLGDLVEFSEVHRNLLHRCAFIGDFAVSLRRWQRADRAVVRYPTLSTSTPGKGLPSSHSRKAPPAVETYVNRPVAPAALSAATVSPPPATVTIFPAAVSSAAASATSTVLMSKGSSSKAPNGPFQTSVLTRASTEQTRSMLRGPMSRIISSSPTPATATTCEGAFAANVLATTASTGNTSSRP